MPINNRSNPGNAGPEIAGFAEEHSPVHKRHEFRFFAHNPEAVGSNPTPATIEPKSIFFRCFLLLNCVFLDCTGLELKTFRSQACKTISKHRFFL